MCSVLATDRYKQSDPGDLLPVLLCRTCATKRYIVRAVLSGEAGTTAAADPI